MEKEKTFLQAKDIEFFLANNPDAYYRIMTEVLVK
jgi:hypothetical protein